MHKERVGMSGRDHHSNSLVSSATDTASIDDGRFSAPALSIGQPTPFHPVCFGRQGADLPDLGEVKTEKHSP